MLDFLLAPFKNRKSRKIHTLLRQLLADLAPTPGAPPTGYPAVWLKGGSSISEGGCGSVACVAGDEEGEEIREKYADVEEFLASATSGKNFQKGHGRDARATMVPNRPDSVEIFVGFHGS